MAESRHWITVNTKAGVYQGMNMRLTLGRRKELRNLILLIVLLVLVYGGLNALGLFEPTRQMPPVLTQALISLSYFPKDWWFLIIAVLAATVLGINRFLSR